MKKIKRSWDVLSKEQRRKAIDEIIRFFEKEHDEQIGMIKAESILDFFLENIGGTLHNKGVEKSRDLLKTRFDDFQVDLDLLLNQ